MCVRAKPLQAVISIVGVTSPIETHVKIVLLDVRLSAGGVYEHPLPKSYQGFVYCWRGSGERFMILFNRIIAF